MLLTSQQKLQDVYPGVCETYSKYVIKACDGYLRAAGTAKSNKRLTLWSPSNEIE